MALGSASERAIAPFIAMRHGLGYGLNYRYGLGKVLGYGHRHQLGYGHYRYFGHYHRTRETETTAEVEHPTWWQATGRFVTKATT